jgi:hypothetical protein
MKTRLLSTLFYAALCISHGALGQSTRWVPEDAQQLLAVLVGTVWAADGKSEECYTFLSDGHFKGSELQPTYTITGRRMLIMHWGPETNIRCLINEECSAMTELGGERHTFVRVQ